MYKKNVELERENELKAKREDANKMKEIRSYEDDIRKLKGKMGTFENNIFPQKMGGLKYGQIESQLNELRSRLPNIPSIKMKAKEDNVDLLGISPKGKGIGGIVPDSLNRDKLATREKIERLANLTTPKSNQVRINTCHSDTKAKSVKKFTIFVN